MEIILLQVLFIKEVWFKTKDLSHESKDVQYNKGAKQ